MQRGSLQMWMAPMAIGDIPAKMAGVGGRVRHPARYYARCARAPKIGDWPESLCRATWFPENLESRDRSDFRAEQASGPTSAAGNFPRSTSPSSFSSSAYCQRACIGSCAVRAASNRQNP